VTKPGFYFITLPFWVAKVSCSEGHRACETGNPHSTNPRSSVPEQMEEEEDPGKDCLTHIHLENVSETVLNRDVVTTGPNRR